jgi:acetyl esterase/lipase
VKSKFILTFFLFLSASGRSGAQDFIPLWPEGKMPNTKGMKVQDAVSDERFRSVGTPGVYAFFPSKQENKRAAVVICPGGGYKHLSHEVSGTQIAKWFNTMGASAFVLISRLPHSPDLVRRDQAPLQDAQRAVRLIRHHAATWGIDPGKVGVMGFSAGGHLASTLGTHLEDVSRIGDETDTVSFRPAFMLLVSPVITMGPKTHKGSRDNLLGENPSAELIQKYSSELLVSDQTPPAFIAVADDDKSVDPANSILFYNALREKGISASLHVFPSGGHAIALRNNPGSTQLWTVLCEMWLVEMNFIPEKAGQK